MILGPEADQRPAPVSPALPGVSVIPKGLSATPLYAPPARPSGGAVVSPPRYTTTPLTAPPKPVGAGTVLAPPVVAPPIVPHQAQAALQEQPRLTPQQQEEPAKPKVREDKPRGKRQGLQDYSYELSLPELERVRLEQPTAQSTVSTSMKLTPLSWEDYDSLSNDQRAAVNFNSLLVEAREADLKTDPKFYTEDDKNKYRTDVESIFGAGGGSETIGFNTVALLKKINFKAVGQDLDEFLSLERGITFKELKDFKLTDQDAKQLQDAAAELTFGDQTAFNKEYAAVRTDKNMAAVDTTAIKAMMTAYKAKHKPGSEEGWRTWDLQGALGIQMPSPNSPMRGVQGALETTYNMLRANPNQQGLDWLQQDFTARGWTDQDKSMLWDYLNTRTTQEVSVTKDKTAQQIRTLLGWE